MLLMLCWMVGYYLETFLAFKMLADTQSYVSILHNLMIQVTGLSLCIDNNYILLYSLYRFCGSGYNMENLP